MKQSINSEQYNELSDKSKIKWLAWTKEKGYDILVDPNIGVLIEFLDQDDEDYFNTAYTTSDAPNITKWNKTLSWEYEEELCDALWEACKQILERE